ncbi:hypothetical protein RHSIM_Rhsim09G0092800 [Rhododendron simsii]|uniref:Uncharacterized protein n=1 Tax=Rhododendron simsii TaxID=118357 RepID=A0A834GH19_RHOSS|nr:hypothetical protein RHSIM_Rhsim09G0092800 [Rhododendron simsii]
MVRTKTLAAKGKGKATTSVPEQAEEVVREMEEEEEMIANLERGRAKRRTAAEVRAANQKKWEESLRGMGFKNERHVDVDNLGIENPCVRRIQEQDLAYYLAPNPGYNKELVIEFYKNMKIPSKEDEDKDDAKITSKIGKVSIEVTSGFIAPAITAPRGAYLTTLPPKGARAASWNKLLFCQGVAIMGCMKKIKKETRDNARRQQRIDHKLDWVMSRGQGQASEPYEPPPVEPDEDSDDFAGGEPEFLDDE